MRRLFLASTLLFISITIFAQNRAEQYLMYSQEADDLLHAGKQEEAIAKYLDAYDIVKDKKSKSKAYHSIGVCYLQLDNFDKQVEYMLKSNELDNANYEPLHFIAKAYQSQGDYESSITYFKKYLSRRPFSKEAQAGLRSSEAALKWKDDPPSADLHLDYDLSSSLPDASLTFVNEANTELILISNRDDSKEEGPLTPYMYYSESIEGTWTKPRAIDISKENSGRVNSVCYSKNRSIIFFSRCKGTRYNAYQCDIYYAFLKGGMKGQVKSIGIKNEEDINIIQPSYSDELNTLFFVSDKDQSLNDRDTYTDIWYVKYNPEDDTWGEPVRLGPEVNSGIDEYYPSIHPNGDLYFSSFGHTGLGGMDIFVSKKYGDMKWGRPENLKAPINSSHNDYRMLFNADNSSGLFTSERKGGYGGSDIFSFKLLDDKDKISPVEKPDIHKPVYNTLNEEEETFETLKTIFNNETPMTCPGNNYDYELTILPNPNRGTFAWQFKSTITNTFTVKIYNTSGQVLYSKEARPEGGTIRDKINLSENGVGAYYLQVLLRKREIVCDKVIVQQGGE